MLLNRISMRISVIIAIIVMGGLSLSIAVISGRIYRDHAIENARSALSEQVRVGVEIMRRRLEMEAEAVVRKLNETWPVADSKLSRGESAPKLIDKVFAHYSGVKSPLPLVEITIYDKTHKLISRRNNQSTLSSPHVRGICEPAKDQVASGSVEASQADPFSGYCLANDRLYYSALLNTGEPYRGYAQIIFDVIPATGAAENVLGLPVRFALSGGAIIHQSAGWPNEDDLSKALTASLPIEVSGNKVLLIQVTKDASGFFGRLDQTRYAAFLAAVAITFLFVLIAIAILERMAIAPVRNLVEHLRGIRQDESQLGSRIDGTGNVETVQLAEAFNAMTGKLEGLYEQLHHMTFTDPLTQLPNRGFLQKRLEQTVAHSQRDNRTFALCIMDLDRFKGINDTLGHQVGDLLLQQVAARLRDKLRDSDTIVRMGGDEFAVLLPTVTAKQADMAARMLVQSLRSAFTIETHHLDVGASIGVVLYPDHGVDSHILIQRAEVAMYAAKQAGCGHMFYDDQMDRHHPAQLTLMAELRQAVEQEQFVLYYQPKIGLKTNRVIGVEALVRWRHPSGRLIMPETFIPLLEQTGLIRSLTGWVTHEALRMAGELRKKGFELPVAVNISARDLQNAGLAEELAEQVAVHRATPQWLELEITESAVMSDIAGAQDLLTRISAMGFRVLIDDFGTGYSSLAYLKRLPVHAVKIDKSFVMGMARDENDAAIVYTSIDLSHNLGLQVVAEGVDEESALLRLRSRGCDAVQGMYLSRPLSSEELVDWLAKSNWGIPARLAC